MHTISAAPTSITAFVGRTARGPVDAAVAIGSFPEFERLYGGLWLKGALGYAVRDFFEQGGRQAIVVRVHHAVRGDRATIDLGAGPSRLRLRASSPGAWGSRLSASAELSEPSPTSFHLTVSDGATGVAERFERVSCREDDPRRVDLVVDERSALVEVVAPLPATPPLLPASATAEGGSDGEPVGADDITTGEGLRERGRGLYALDHVDRVNLVVLAPHTPDADVEDRVLEDTIAYATERRALVIVDPPARWADVDAAVAAASELTSSPNAAVYFPRIRRPDPLRGGELTATGPAGAVAGVIARMDATRGVWRAPAGADARIAGVTELTPALTDDDIARLNPLAVNCLRELPGGEHVIWGARTRAGDDADDPQWRYLPVRRLTLHIEASLYRGTKWVVFEPNDEPLWSQIRLDVGAFMQDLFRAGAFAGTTAREAYFVTCDATNNAPADIDRGIVSIRVGFAPLKPSEFVVVELRQLAEATGGQR
ncbi:MAG: uncharacterized protein QOE31_519 [Solirubrobacteraceae bacterium]|nr:uncharacterized protein [Solirubrobacteraceae bacterium]